jgi:hypothetical protein
MYMKKILKIYCTTHIHPVIVQNEFIIPLQLRKRITGIDLGYISDDSGDNISNKGISYGGALPAFYWAWKNDNTSDYIGFCHYRRYFLLDEKHNYFQIEYVTDENGLKKISFSDKYIMHILDKYDVILSKKKRFTTSIWKRYSNLFDERDLIALKCVIRNIYPDYIKLFEKYIEKGNCLSIYGMFITSKDIFDNFCSWIFPVILKLDDMKDPSKNSLSRPRQIDYIVEHLMQLYFIKNNELKIKHLPIIVADNTKYRISNIRYFLSQIKTEFRFLLNI